MVDSTVASVLLAKIAGTENHVSFCLRQKQAWPLVGRLAMAMAMANNADDMRLLGILLRSANRGCGFMRQR